MNCFLYATDSGPSPLSIPSPNPNSICASHPNPNPNPNLNLCPDFSFKFPALERDYMGVSLGYQQGILDKKIPASLTISPLTHKSSLTDPSPNDDLCGSHLKLAPPSGAGDDGDADDSEPLSATIGWPPISSYRKSTTRGLSIKPPCSTETITPLIVHEAPLEEETTNNNIDDENEAFTVMHMKASLIRKPLHIKVSMDGTPIMRKLDLESMQGYHHLSLELHKLFKFYKRNLSCEVGVHSCFKDLSGASFLLTYKDKDGDWMLVGDTPWETFARSARRIRIMRKVK